MKRALPWIVVGGIVLVLVLAFARRIGQTNDKNAAAKAATEKVTTTSVKTAVVERKDLPEILQITGSVKAQNEVQVLPKSPGRVIQECGVGLVPVRIDGEDLAFAAPPLLRQGSLEPEVMAQIIRGLRIPDSAIRAGRWIDNGPGWCAVLLDSVERVLALTPDFAALGDLKLGVAALYPPDGASQLEVRAFVPSLSVPEDPVTGSLNAGLALWLIGEGLLPPRYVASQGAAVGRAGRVTVSAEADGTWIGGQAVIVLEGTAALD